MANLSPQTLERLNKFKSSDKFSSLNQQTQERLNNFLGSSTQPIENQEQPEQVNPFKEALNTTGEVLSGGFKRQMAAGLTSFNTITGGPATEFAHGVKTEALNRAGMKPFKVGNFPNAPTSLKAISPLANLFQGQPIELDPAESLSSATDAQSIIGSILALSPSLGKMMKNKATKFGVKARDEAVRLFPQAKGNIEQVRNTAEQVSKYISPSKNYEEIANQLEMAKGINAGERAKLYSSGKVLNTGSEHQPIMSKISEIENSAFGKTQEGQRAVKMLKDIQTADVDFINQQSKNTLHDPNFYQKQKSIYQKKANASGAYRENPSEAIKADAYRAMAEGYQNKTYEVNDLIKGINLEEKGLIEGTNYSREMAKGEAMGLKPDLRKEVAYSISPSAPQSAARFARKGIWDRLMGNPEKGLSKKIAKYASKSEKAQSVADLLESIGSPESNVPQKLIGQNKQLSLPPPKEAIELPYTGSPSGPPIEMWSDYYMIKPSERVGNVKDVSGVSNLKSDFKTKMIELAKRRSKNFGNKK